MVPPVITASLSGNVPAAWPMGTTIGICASETPMELSRSVFHPLWVWSIPSEAVTPVSTAGSPEMALVATAWQGQYPRASGTSVEAQRRKPSASGIVPGIRTASSAVALGARPSRSP